MKVSELIAALQAAQSVHGDALVMIRLPQDPGEYYYEKAFDHAGWAGITVTAETLPDHSDSLRAWGFPPGGPAVVIAAAVADGEIE